MPKKKVTGAKKTGKKRVVSTPPRVAPRQMTIRLSAVNWRRIKVFAIGEDISAQALILRAVSRLIVERGEPPLDED